VLCSEREKRAEWDVEVDPRVHSNRDVKVPDLMITIIKYKQTKCQKIICSLEPMELTCAFLWGEGH
jgi:hypothetical protein